jgi:cytidylate kinase
MKGKKNLHIAIDGPAGAGKSTVAREVAKKLGICYLDTGAMYRVVAYKVLASGILLGDEEKVSSIAKTTKIRFGYGGKQSVYCDEIDVTDQIRSPEVSRAVSVVASYQGVRESMVRLQREEATKGSLVMDGRDIGTYVLPEADVKIYLTALAEERAQRRHLENIEAGKESNFEQVLLDIEARDRLDSEREHAPLRPAENAIILDTTGLSIGEVTRQIVKIVREA